jgi:hypothetical protein
MKNQVSFWLILIALVFVIIGCGSSPKPAGSGDTPAFVSNPPEDKAMIFGIGGVRKANARQQIQLADTRANRDIAEQLGSLVQGMIADYSREAGIEGSQAVAEFQEAVCRSLLTAGFADAHLIKRESTGDGTIYSLIVIKKTDALRHTADILDTEVTRFVEFKNVNFPAELERRLDAARMKPTIIIN